MRGFFTKLQGVYNDVRRFVVQWLRPKLEHYECSLRTRHLIFTMHLRNKTVNRNVGYFYCSLCNFFSPDVRLLGPHCERPYCEYHPSVASTLRLAIRNRIKGFIERDYTLKAS
jgi:hypothetical protein